ncbi:hypothetical protein SeLEV6574_g01598 [Synchytrium endobioticum]|uniref:Uncharacterized protein n=1 Tax=Synchytrium endobioticum TaxID=286115 RepID=A0A507DEC2_9FUNG|nr:hypothetical protein SeLEV6574_g01598 [Synchytrium endobioticum]
MDSSASIATLTYLSKAVAALQDSPAMQQYMNSRLHQKLKNDKIQVQEKLIKSACPICASQWIPGLNCRVIVMSTNDLKKRRRGQWKIVLLDTLSSNVHHQCYVCGVNTLYRGRISSHRTAGTGGGGVVPSAAASSSKGKAGPSPSPSSASSPRLAASNMSKKKSLLNLILEQKQKQEQKESSWTLSDFLSNV